MAKCRWAKDGVCQVLVTPAGQPVKCDGRPVCLGKDYLIDVRDKLEHRVENKGGEVDG